MTPARIRPEIAHLATPIGEVREAARNDNEGDVDTIRDSLRFHGQYKPVIARRDTREILAGNHTLKAALAEGWPELAVQWLEDLDDDEAQRILLVDNHSRDGATYNRIALGSILQDLENPHEGTGFTAGEVEHLIAYGQTLEDPPAFTPPAIADAITRPGDTIRLGRHRLHCGDARDPAAWAELMGPDQADIVWTDPPYGVNLNDIAAQRGRDHGEMAGDNLDAHGLHELARATFANAHAYTRPGAAIYVAHADTMREPIHTAFIGAGFYHAQTLVWVKDSLVLGRQDYQWRHEPILYGWRSGDAHHWHAGRDQTTIAGDYNDRDALEALEHADLVELAHRLLHAQAGTLIRVKRPRVADEHPTSKPVDLIAPHLRNSSEPGAIVADPFGGSGSTLIAAEQTDRAARLLELDPGYCDVIVARWETLTEQQAQRPTRRRRRKPPA